MSFVDKLMFWKKKEPDLDMNFGQDLGLGNMDMGGGAGTPNMGIPGMNDPGFVMDENKPEFGFAKPADLQGEMPPEVANAPNFGGAFGQPRPQPMPIGSQPQVVQSYGQPMQQQDPQVVSAKLDSIKYALDAIDQRLKNMERLQESKERERGRW
ncbi:MAG: hypothetical protein Q8O89_06985 [Nanoarchaeota archaeon]|nr:hypothetical protein [Nanoarchaeota archaeon]